MADLLSETIKFYNDEDSERKDVSGEISNDFYQKAGRATNNYRDHLEKKEEKVVEPKTFSLQDVQQLKNDMRNTERPQIQQINEATPYKDKNMDDDDLNR